MTVETYTAKDFKSANELRWCPGCGDYAIINAIQRTMAEMGIAKEDFAVISGIGCSSRLPYYMSTFGFHTIHGRAAAIASGTKLANPDLSVWIMTGDGDSMAIGGNHFIHLVRRNIDVNLVLFNNKIYGLTKGQYSPTSERNFISKTSPYGTIEDPFVPGQLVIGAGGTFFARSLDSNLKGTQTILAESAKHKGASIIEVLQNCVIFNNGVHREIADPQHRSDRQLWLEHGKPMIFGQEDNKGIALKNGKLQVVEIGKDGVTEDDILVHDAHQKNPYLHMALINMQLPEFPVAFGVIRNIEAPAYDQEMEKQIKEVKEHSKIKSMDDLMQSGHTWEVE